MYSKDLVSNASTGLMAIKDIATYKEIPIIGFMSSSALEPRARKRCLSTRRTVIEDLPNPMKYTTGSKKLWMN